MKLNIKCPKCDSTNVSIMENPKGIEPMYKCNKCSYKHTLFPQFENKSEAEDENKSGSEDGDEAKDDNESEDEEAEELEEETDEFEETGEIEKEIDEADLGI